MHAHNTHTHMHTYKKEALGLNAEELVHEADVVPGKDTMPHGKEHQGEKLRRILVVERLEALEDVARNPLVGVDV